MKFKTDQVAIWFNYLIEFLSWVDVRDCVYWASDDKVQNINMNICRMVKLLNIVKLENQVT